MAERRVAASLSTSSLKRRGETILPCAMPESTQGWRDRATKTDLGQGTTEEICEQVPLAPRDTEIKETDKSGFDPAGVESLLQYQSTQQRLCSWQRRRKVPTRLKAIASAPQRKPPWEGSSCGRMMGRKCEHRSGARKL